MGRSLAYVTSSTLLFTALLLAALTTWPGEPARPDPFVAPRHDPSEGSATPAARPHSGLTSDKSKRADGTGRIDATPYSTDVAPLLNATVPGYGTSTAWGDYDGDGDLNLHVVNLGYQGSGQANVLLRNDGSTFTDVTASAGVGDGGPGVAAVWGDMDNDGDLDLFVSNRPGSNALYRNEGDGHFTNVAVQAGLTDPAGWGEGSAWIGHDSDGLLDLYVANLYIQGQQPNRLYHNLDGYHFVDVAGLLGLADTGNGEGTAWADFDNDGDQDLYVANAYGTNALYQQQAVGKPPHRLFLGLGRRFYRHWRGRRAHLQRGRPLHRHTFGRERLRSGANHPLPGGRTVGIPHLPAYRLRNAECEARR